jgi:hypothetical protein
MAKSNIAAVTAHRGNPTPVCTHQATQRRNTTEPYTDPAAPQHGQTPKRQTLP